MNSASAVVLPFEQIDRTSLPVVGGKGANLGELARAGFPVPSGFCVTTHAYAEVAAGSAIAEVLAQLATTAIGDNAALTALAGRAREAMLQAPVPAEVTEAVAAAYRGLGADVPVAVRSSATAEDLPDASFAGQQDTYLNVIGVPAVLDAVRRCWASLWTDRAVAYRASHSIDHREVRLSVVVQRLVQAQVAGVLFTANPVSGRRRQAVIDASPGLGEAVVSGAVNPDHFEVDALTGAVLQRRLGDKRLSIEVVEGGGTRRVERAGGEGEACVTDAELAALAKLGAAVEAHYGAPQDLEWALGPGRALFLLQARPITTLFPLPASAPTDDRALSVYFNFNVAQGVLRPFTPMGLACWRAFTAGVGRFAAPSGRWEGRVGAPFVRAMAGRMFLEATGALRNALGRKLLSAFLFRAEARSAEQIQPLLADPRLSVVPGSRRRFVRGVLRVLWRTRAPLWVWRTFRDPVRARARFETTAEALLHLGDVRPDATAAERLAAVERMLVETSGRMVPVAATSFAPALASFALARRLLRGLSTPEEHEVAYRALPHNPTTEMDLALFALARRLRAEPALRQRIRETPPRELAAAYAAGTLPPTLQQGLAAFLAQWGMRGVAEIDVGVPRWGEDPTHVLGSLANYLALDDGTFAPDEQFARAVREADAMVETLVARARSKGRLRGAVVRFALSRTRALAGMREAPKFILVRTLARVRALMLGIGRELVAAGRLERADEIVFLDFAEVERAIGGADLRPLVRERIATFEREVGRRHLPRWLLSDGTEPAAVGTREAGTLSGTPASAGVVTGIARVVLDPNGARLEPGEILVAPSTDPGWTPLFLTAGGLVMEMGGAMSHGAVVAREYGIPAVVGVAHAVETIQTGQRIRIDGATGAIQILPEPPAPSAQPAVAAL